MSQQLHLTDTFDLMPPSGMSFRLSTWKPSHFPTRLEIHSQLTTWRTFVFDGRPLGVRLEDRGTYWQCRVYRARKIRSRWCEDDRARLIQRLRKAYGFDEDRSAFQRMCRRDQALRRLPRSFAGMRSSCPESVFEIAVLAVLLQNTTVTRSRDMLDAILRLSGTCVEFDGVQLFAFCTPASLAAVGGERLRAEARVGYRDKVLIALAEFFTTHTIDQVDRAEDLLPMLCSIKGVGPYTAGIVAASVFRDPRAYGLDVWNRQIIMRAMGWEKAMSDDELRVRLSARFAPYEGLVVEMLVESDAMNRPVTSVYPTEKMARAASRDWPRPLTGVD